jgi:hypothetical protein
MDASNIDPKTLTPEQATGLATDWTNAHNDVVSNIRHLMQSAATDITIDNEDLLSTIYKPVVKVATKNTANNETRLGELSDLLIQSAGTQVVTNHGSLKNIQEELSEVLGYDNERTGGTVPQVAGNRATIDTGTTFADKPAVVADSRTGGGDVIGTSGIGVGTTSTGTVGVDSNTGTNQSGGTISETTGEGRQFSITDILGIPSQLPPPEPTPTPFPMPGVEVLPFCPPGVNLRPVTFPNGRKACLGDDGLFYAAECCKPSSTQPPSCVDESTTGGGDLDDRPGPGPDCPKPTFDCPAGTEWWWNESIRQWQCKKPEDIPEPKPKPKPCQDWWNQISLNLNVDCRDLPDEVQKKLTECGFKVCDFKQVPRTGKEGTLGPQLAYLENLWDWQNGLPQSFVKPS